MAENQGGGLHLYALIETNDEHIFDVTGVSDDVYTVQRGGLAAVLSETAVSDYAALPQPELMQYLVGHQRVVEHLLTEFTVLPVKFGTVLPDEATVRRLLREKRSLLHKTHDQVRGLVQMEIVVLWSLQAEIEAIAKALDIAKMQTALVGKLAEEVQATQIEIGKKIHAALGERRATISMQIMPALESIAKRMVRNPLLNDDMVLNVALLLDEAGQTQLDETLEKLDRLTNGAFTIRCVGPLPAHSFATVAVSLPDAAAIEAARALLQLEEQVTLRDIKHAYRKAASLSHPDQQGNVANMQAISQAYRQLTAYAENQPSEPISFDEATLQQTLYVNVVQPLAESQPLQVSLNG